MLNRFIIVLLSLGLLAGCAHKRVKEEPQPGIGLDRLVAYNFVNVLVQVDGLHPDQATIKMFEPNDKFGAALKRVLREANYYVQIVEKRTHEQFVDYSILNIDDDSYKYALNVGQVFMEREYITTASGDVLPDSDLLIEGVDASSITLHDGQPYEVHLPVITSPDSLMEASLDSKPLVEFPTDDLPTDDLPVGDKALEEKSSDTAVQIVPVPLATDIAATETGVIPNPYKQVSVESEANGQSNPSFNVLVNGDESPPGYSEGETLVFTLQAQEDMRVSCYFQDPDAKVMRMYPNSFVTSATVLAGDTVHIPASDQWSVHATRAGSKDEIMCVAVAPEHESAMEKFDASPDFEVLAYKSLDELFVNLSAALGVNPESKRISINVY